MTYIILATRDGRIHEVDIARPGTSSGGCSMIWRVRRVKDGMGKRFKTKQGAERAMRKIVAACEPDDGWRGYGFAVADAE